MPPLPEFPENRIEVMQMYRSAGFRSRLQAVMHSLSMIAIFKTFKQDNRDWTREIAGVDIADLPESKHAQSVASARSKFQIPPDLVVKSQAINIAEVILSLIRQQKVVQTLHRNRKSRLELLFISEAPRSTTKSDGMWQKLLKRPQIYSPPNTSPTYGSWRSTSVHSELSVSHLTVGYCWRIYFNTSRRGFLNRLPKASWPSKKACVRQKFGTFEFANSIHPEHISIWR
jgi:hypothetical protein